jgi:hypothetical protein
VEFHAGMAAIQVQEAAPRFRQCSCEFERVGWGFVLQDLGCNHKGLWRCTGMHGGGNGQYRHQGQAQRPRTVARTYEAWPAPPHPPLHLASVALVLHNWAVERSATGFQLRHILECLSKDYLLCLPLRPGMRVDSCQPEAGILRYLFRRQVATVLRWTQRRAEGRCNGFSDALNTVIRNDVYPN